MAKKKINQPTLEDFLKILNDEEKARIDNIAMLAKEGRTAESALRESFFTLATPIVNRIGGKHPGSLWGAFKAKYLKTVEKGNSHLPLKDLAQKLPYPLGMKLNEILQAEKRRNEGQPEPQFAFEICALMGILVRMTALILIRLFVESGKTDAKINHRIMDGIRNPADGTWLGIAQSLSKSLASEKNSLQVAMTKVLSTKVKLLEKEKSERVKGRNQVGNALQALVSFRNDLIHGTLPDEDILDENLALLEVAVRGFSFLAGYQLLARAGGQVWAVEGSVPRPVEVELNGSLPDGQPCLVARDGESPPVSLSPLLRFHTSGDAETSIEELFFLNSGSIERLSYIGFRSAGHMEGKALGSYEDFKDFLAKIPTPPIPPDPRLDFEELAYFHTQLFVGREDVLGEIDLRIREMPNGYLQLKALPGMGKTAIVAKLYELNALGTSAKVNKGNRWVFHFCSALGGRNSTTVALRSLIAQICDAFELDRKAWLSDDLENLKDEKLPYLLGNVAGKLGTDERLILAFDALDEGFGAEKESIPSSLPNNLPEGVIVLISWRVDKDGKNAKVDDALKGIPTELTHVLDTANPLAGLTRKDLNLYLDKLHESFRITPATSQGADTVWQAASTDAQPDNPAADPFYLRFLASGTQSGSIRLDRPETVPNDLNEAFEDMWMELPTDHDFLAHRLLLYLAVMRDYGDDSLFAELFNRERPNHPPLTKDEVTLIRIKVGKLLVYNGDRYNLFHDRFRYFLVGQQKDPLDNVA
jgi:hypothetical protein